MYAYRKVSAAKAAFTFLCDDDISLINYKLCKGIGIQGGLQMKLFDNGSKSEEAQKELEAIQLHTAAQRIF